MEPIPTATNNAAIAPYVNYMKVNVAAGDIPPSTVGNGRLNTKNVNRKDASPRRLRQPIKISAIPKAINQPRRSL
jgi:hypothetical protein